eukprot:CAMPEP_0195288304 /NCGR_PEP_ID=MMETSP0707-20130614/5023_1 /TAXON_ID=33640 /ORGANISM="Asterionellopsis glacialis, Strain CCMP134" /LENGTH=292 /DNA_ID=CAMNT_0040348155 /DNA_START=287 /DNA_END=1165 /DNA_ORIENTATION=+
MSICLWGGTGSAEYATSTYPQGIFVMMESEEDTILGVKRGDCQFGLTSVQSWERLESDKSINGDCNLEWVGRVVKFVEAGFAIKNDAGNLCTSLIQDVFNLHMVEMQADGFIEQAWKEFFQKKQDLDCSSVAAVPENDSSQLSLNEMAGTFFFHFLATMLAFTISGASVLYRKFTSQKPRRYSTAIEQLDVVDVDVDVPTETLYNRSFSPGSTSERKNSDKTLHPPSDLQEQLQELRDCQMDQSRAQDEQKAQMSKMMSLLEELNVEKQNRTKKKKRRTEKPPMAPDALSPA